MHQQLSDNQLLARAERQDVRDLSAAEHEAIWEATTYDGRGLIHRMLELARLGPGACVLDIGLGLGELALSVGRALGPGGMVVGMDVSRKRVELAARRAAWAGVSNVFFIDGDAEHLESEVTFDAILARFVLHRLAHLERSLAAIRELLVPKGRLIVAVWGRAYEVPILSLPLDGLARTLGGSLPPYRANPFLLGDPEVLESYIQAAGFRDICVEAALVTFTFASVEEYVADQQTRNRLVRVIIQSQPLAQQEELWHVVRESVQHHVGLDGRVRLSNVALIASAQR
jgi:enediyne biosynthesis protein CalE5